MISKDLGEGMGGVTMATDLGIGPQIDIPAKVLLVQELPKKSGQDQRY